MAGVINNGRRVLSKQFSKGAKAPGHTDGLYPRIAPGDHVPITVAKVHSLLGAAPQRLQRHTHSGGVRFLGQVVCGADYHIKLVFAKDLLHHTPGSFRRFVGDNAQANTPGL